MERTPFLPNHTHWPDHHAGKGKLVLFAKLPTFAKTSLLNHRSAKHLFGDGDDAFLAKTPTSVMPSFKKTKDRVVCNTAHMCQNIHVCNDRSAKHLLEEGNGKSLATPPTLPDPHSGRRKFVLITKLPTFAKTSPLNHRSVKPFFEEGDNASLVKAPTLARSSVRNTQASVAFKTTHIDKNISCE